MLDGGVCDSIPVCRAREDGFLKQCGNSYKAQRIQEAKQEILFAEVPST